MRDGSAIIRAIGDYANYKQRQEQIEYQRDQQDYENRLAERRMAMDEHRQNTRLNMQIDEANYRTSERERIASERQRSQDARQSLVQQNMSELEAYEQKAIDAIGKGASGEGQGVEVIDDGDSVVLGVKKSDGRVDPFTKNPRDQNSPPFRIPKESFDQARDHAARSAQIAEQNGASPEDTEAYIRAGFTIGEDGKARPASETEFVANLEEQGLLGRGGVPEDVPTEANLQASKANDPKPVGGEVKGLVDYAGELYEGGNRGAKQLYNVLIRGDLLKQSGVSDKVKKVGERILFGSSGVTSLDKKGEVKVRPTASVSTPDGVADLEETKKGFDAMGGEPPKTAGKTSEVAKLADPEEKMRAIREKFEAKRKRAAVVGELYITGNIDEAQMRNYMETGDMRFSKYDIEKHDVSVQAQDARNKAVVAKAEQQLYEKKKSYIEAVDKSKDNTLKLRNTVTKQLQDISASTADWYSGLNGLKGEKAKGIKGRLDLLATKLIGSNVFSEKNMLDPTFGTMYAEGLRSFLADRGKDGELSAETVLPYVTSALGRFKPVSAQTILRATTNTGRPLGEVRQEYSDKLNESMKGVNEKGIDWSDGHQQVFDDEYLARNLQARRE